MLYYSTALGLDIVMLLALMWRMSTRMEQPEFTGDIEFIAPTTTFQSLEVSNLGGNSSIGSYGSYGAGHGYAAVQDASPGSMVGYGAGYGAAPMPTFGYSAPSVQYAAPIGTVQPDVSQYGSQPLLPGSPRGGSNYP